MHIIFASSHQQQPQSAIAQSRCIWPGVVAAAVELR